MIQVIDPIKGIAHRHIDGKTFILLFDPANGRIITTL
jgi:hypothetical protein